MAVDDINSSVSQPTVELLKPPPPPPPPPVQTVRPSQYVVKPGDSLWAIGRRYGVSVDAMIRANPQIANPNLIFPGQVVNVPSDRFAAPPPGATPPVINPSAPAASFCATIDPRVAAKLSVSPRTSGEAGSFDVAQVVYQDPEAAGGNHNVFVRVVGPDGQVLPPEDVEKYFTVQAMHGTFGPTPGSVKGAGETCGVPQDAWTTGANSGPGSKGYFDVPLNNGGDAVTVWVEPRTDVPNNPYAGYGSQQVGPFRMGDQVTGHPNDHVSYLVTFRARPAGASAVQPGVPWPGGATDLGQLVESVYNSELGRASDPGGKAHWMAFAQNLRARGMADVDIHESLVAMFHQSTEYRLQHAAGPVVSPPTGPEVPTAPVSPGTQRYLANGAVPVRWGGSGPVTPDRVLVGYNVNAANNASLAFEQAQAGARFFLMMDNPGAAAALKAQFPDAIVVDRRYMPPSNGLPSPTDFVRGTLGLAPPARAAPGVIYQGLNEADVLGQGMDPVAIPQWAYALEPSLAGRTQTSALELRAIWDREVARQINLAGGTYAAGTFSVGTPGITDADPQAAAARAIFRKYYAPLYNAGQILFDMHLYSPSLDHLADTAGQIWYERRWEYLYTQCGFNPAVRGLISTETGIDDGAGFAGHGVGGAQVVGWVNAFKAAEARPLVVNGRSYPSPFLGGALFELAPSGDWARFDVGGYVNDLRATYPH